MKKILTKENIVFLFLIIVTSVLLYLNIPSRISNYGKDNFDWWSNEIMLSDIIYIEDFGYDSLFQKVITPNSNLGYEPENRYNLVYNYFVVGASFNKSSYDTYYSNLTVQRVFYHLINYITGKRHRITIRVLYVINIIMMAIVYMLIIMWISKISNKKIAFITYFIIIFLAPSFTMYTKNLYWCSWTLFLPFIASIYAYNKGYYKNNFLKFNLIIFAACFVKQLFYFEFLSTVFVSPFVPLLYYIYKDDKIDKTNVIRVIKTSLVVIASFIAVSIIKFLMLSFEYNSMLKAYNTFIIPIINRLIGNKSDIVFAASANEPILNVIKIMFNKPAILLWNNKYISQIALFLISCILMIFNIIFSKKSIREEISLVIILIVSFIGTVSWFIVAKPHTYIHNVQCEILWFLPLAILEIFYITRSIEKVVSHCRKK